MLKLNISKAISMRPRKDHETGAQRKASLRKADVGSQNAEDQDVPRTDGISGPEGLPEHHASRPGPSFPRSRIPLFYLLPLH